MRLAYVCSDLGVPIGGTKGASIHVRALAQELALRGHQVSVLAANMDGELSDDFRPAVCGVGFDRTLKSIKRRVASRDPFTSAPREAYAMLLGNLVWDRLALLHADRPLDGIYERHSLWSWAALRFAREHRLPLVLEVNAPLVDESSKYRQLAMADVAAACEQELIGGASSVVVPSDELAERAVELGARRGDVHVLPNGVDPRLFADPAPLPPERTAALDGRFVIAFVGSLKPWHGIDLLVARFRRLAARLPEAHLLVLGDGPAAAEVAALAAELGSDRVTAPGAVPHDRVPAWLRHADVGVAPYPELDDFYFSPMKVVEYQAAGLPVVASDLGHLRRQIEDGVTGFLVGAGDGAAFEARLVELAADRERSREMGTVARRRVLAHSTWRAVAERVEGLFYQAGLARYARAVGGSR